MSQLAWNNPSKKIHKRNLERLVVAAHSLCVLYWSEFRHVVASVEKALISSQEMHREKQALQRGKSKMKKETDYSIRNQRNVLGGIQEWRYMSDSFFQLHLCCRAAARHHQRCHHILRSPK
jgi:hypothetical protein